MVYLAGCCCVEQPRIGTHLTQDRPVLGDFSTDLFGNQSPGMAVCQHGANHRQAGIDSLVEHANGVVQVDQCPQFKTTGLDDHTGISSGRQAIDRKDAQRWWAVENHRSAAG